MEPIIRSTVLQLARELLGEKDMDRRFTLTLLAVFWLAAGSAACGQPEGSCAYMWKEADINDDGVLVGPEGDDGHYNAYFRVRAQVAPIDGRISRAHFMNACTYNWI
jgi:hypothetical protein